MGKAIFLNRSGGGHLNRPSTVRGMMFQKAFSMAFRYRFTFLGYRFHVTAEKIKLAYIEWPSTPIFFTKKGMGSILFCLDFFVFLYLRLRNYKIFVFYRDAYWAYGKERTFVEKLKTFIGPLELWWLEKVAHKICVPSKEFAAYLGLSGALELPPGCNEMTPDADKFFGSSALVKDSRYRLIYVGGVDQNFYDLSYLQAAASVFRVTICCRSEELPYLDRGISRLVSVGEIELVHRNIIDDPSYLRMFDFGFLCHPPSDFKSVAMPYKFFEYLAAGLPVLVDSNSPAAKIVEKHGVGWVVENICDLEGIVEAIDEVSFDKKRRNCAHYVRQNRWADRVSTVIETALKC